MSTHTHIPQALANMASMHTDTHVYKVHASMFTHMQTHLACIKDMCAYAQISTYIHPGINTPSTHVDGGVCNTGICVHAHTKTHENT